MEGRRRKRLEEKAEILKAIAHPMRLYIVEELASGGRCVGDLCQFAGIGLSSLSFHLKRMENAGVLAERRNQKRVFYSLSAGTRRALDEIGKCAESVLSRKTRRLKRLCRTADGPVTYERRRNR
jgi:ArsR family transcriptional regulator